MFRLNVSMERGERDAANVIKSKTEALRPKVIRNDRSLRLAGHKVAGTTNYRPLGVANVGMVQTYYALRTGPDTVLFAFRELREDGPSGEPSAEWKQMERWLQESLKVLPPAGK